MLKTLTLTLPLFLLALPGIASADQFPKNQVSGTITFNGAPLPGVTVTAYVTNTSSVYAVTTTDQNGNYQLGLGAWSHGQPVPNPGDNADYEIWASAPGYLFSPSVARSATIEATRADHTWDFMGNRVTDIAIYYSVIHYSALPNSHNLGAPGPPVYGADFLAFDGSNPPVTVAPTLRAANFTASETSAGRIGALVWKSRFTDNQDGTVTDNLTGLIWLQNAGCFTASNWADALVQVNALASGACGLADGSVAGAWRVPNLNELESVVDVSASSPALTPGHPFLNVSNAIYWSSTSYFGGQSGSPTAWAIRFSDGRYMNDGASNNKQTSLNQAWAVKGTGGGAVQLQATGQYVKFAPGDDGDVRSGVPLTFRRFLDKGDGTVEDAVTGLVWLKQADCINQTWAGAITTINALADGKCGLTDGSQAGSWRMPTRNEMQSLEDRAENNHSDYFNHTYYYNDGTLFQPPIFTNFMRYQYYWTATPDAADATLAWTVFSCDFGVYDTPKANLGYTLAVRPPAGSAQTLSGPGPMRGAR